MRINDIPVFVVCRGAIYRALHDLAAGSDGVVNCFPPPYEGGGQEGVDVVTI